MTSCPICLEDIFQPPPATEDDVDGNNGIGNANNNNYNIGATVPCGHLYHYGCFDAWRASSHGRAIKCPTCNIKTTDFTRLFLDISSINGLVCQRASSSEDDISLSSIEDDDDDDDDDDDEDDDDEDDDDENDESGSTAEVEVEIVESNVQEEEEGNTATSTSSTEASTTREQSAAEVVVDAEEVVDLTQSPSTSRRRRKQNNSTKLSQSNDDGDVDDPHDELQRLTRIAKKFKRQFLQKNLQYKEQYNEKRKLSERVRQVDEELLEMQSGMEEIERNQGMTILHLKESRLSLQRTLTERDVLKSKYLMMEKLKSKVDSQLKKCHSHYEKELDKARTASMSEVQQILEAHPQVVEENRILKQKLQKLSHKKSSSTNSGNNSRDISKALRQMDDEVRSKNNIQSTSSSKLKSTNRSQIGKQQQQYADFDRHHNKNHHQQTNSNKSSSNNRASALKVGSGQYSSFASRMMTASAKKSSQNVFVRDMLSSTSSRDGKNKTSENKKRSLASSSSTSLSLSQNKRMKSSNDARRFFQPKPS